MHLTLFNWLLCNTRQYISYAIMQYSSYSYQGMIVYDIACCLATLLQVLGSTVVVFYIGEVVFYMDVVLAAVGPTLRT